MATAEPTPAQRDELYALAFDLHEANRWRNLAFAAVTQSERAFAEEPATTRGRDEAIQNLKNAETAIKGILGRISQWIDAHPTVRIDKSNDRNAGFDDTEIVVEVATSTHSDSVPLFQKMVKHQPDILTRDFQGKGTIAEHIRDAEEELMWTAYLATSRGDIKPLGVGVLRQKLNPGRKEELVLERLLGKPGEVRKSGPFQRGVPDLIRETLTGKPLEKQLGSRTVGRGRRKTRRRVRKTKSRTRKTK